MEKVRIEMCVALAEGESAEAYFPKKAHPDDAAYDVFAADWVRLEPGQTGLVPAGFKIQLPRGYEAQIRPRSGNALKRGIQIANSPGTIDCGYVGEVGVIVYNAGKAPLTIEKGSKVAQMVICRLPEVELERVDSIDKETERGSGGFGSTGLA